MVSHCPVHSKPQVDQLMENIDIARAPGTQLFWEAPVMRPGRGSISFSELSFSCFDSEFCIFVGRTLSGRKNGYTRPCPGMVDGCRITGQVPSYSTMGRPPNEPARAARSMINKVRAIFSVAVCPAGSHACISSDDVQGSIELLHYYEEHCLIVGKGAGDRALHIAL